MQRAHKENRSLVPSAEDYQKFGRKAKLLTHPDNIPDTNISLPSRKQTDMTGGESKIGKNYHDSCEKLGISAMRIPKNNKRPTKKANEGSKISKNYQDFRENSEASNTEMLNNIDCSVEN